MQSKDAADAARLEELRSGVAAAEAEKRQWEEKLREARSRLRVLKDELARRRATALRRRIEKW